MSFKRLFGSAILACAGLAAYHAVHPGPAAAAGAQEQTVIGRAEHRVGRLFANLASNSVKSSVAKTEHELAVLGPIIKRTQGPNQRRAMKASAQVLSEDSIALASLDGAHPISAIKRAISARGFLDMVREDVSDEMAAR